MSKTHSYKTGDIFYCSWGYDQTNIDFYQVVGVTDKSVRIRKIQTALKPSKDFTHDHATPVPGAFTGDAMMKRVGSRGSLKITSYSWAYPYEGQTLYQTGWGYGH